MGSTRDAPQRGLAEGKVGVPRVSPARPARRVETVVSSVVAIDRYRDREKIPSGLCHHHHQRYERTARSPFHQAPLVLRQLRLRGAKLEEPRCDQGWVAWSCWWQWSRFYRCAYSVLHQIRWVDDLQWATTIDTVPMAFEDGESDAGGQLSPAGELS